MVVWDEFNLQRTRAPKKVVLRVSEGEVRLKVDGISSEGRLWYHRARETAWVPALGLRQNGRGAQPKGSNFRW